jgi:hypothetical protein
MRAELERPRAGKPNRIQQILESLRKAESDAAIRDRRSAERTPFVRPVLITLGRDKHTKIQATSSNLSQTGICLIHDVELQVRRMGVLTIYRLHDDPIQIRADVRWCQPFCGSWFVTGWRFIAEERN